jgi:hypothetical protein
MTTSTGEESGTGAAVAVLASPPAPSVVAVMAEVRELLERRLMDGDDELKIETLHKLAGYFAVKDDDPSAYSQNAEHRRAVEHWNGCHLVLIAVRRQLFRADGPHRAIVHGAIQFLVNWITGIPERCDALARFEGIGVIVQAARAFHTDDTIRAAAICFFLGFTSDNDEKRLRDIVGGDAFHYIIQAMISHPTKKSLQLQGLHFLKRVVDVLGHEHRGRLVKKGALVAVSGAYSTYLDSDVQILALSKNLMSKLCPP